MNPGTARAALRIAPFVVWGGVLVAWLILFAPSMVTYAFGSPVTATITRCETTYSGDTTEDTKCYGTWRTDGERHSGRIYGGDRYGEEEQVTVRATKGRAATADTLRFSLMMTGFMILLGLAAHGISWFKFSRAARASAARP